MEVTPSDVLKVMKSPPIWEDYKKIINKAEGHEVKCCILELHIIVSGFLSRLGSSLSLQKVLL